MLQALNSHLWLVATILDASDQFPTMVTHVSKFRDLLALEYIGACMMGHGFPS